MGRFIGASRLRSLRAIGTALRRVPVLLWRTNSGLTVLLIALQCGLALVPVGQLWVAKLILDQLVEALRLPDPLAAGDEIQRLVAIGFGLAIASLALREGVNLGRTLLSGQLTVQVTTQILAHAQRLDLEIFERPEFYDRLRRAEQGSNYRPAGLLFQMLNVVQGAVSLAGLAAVLIGLHPLALPFLLLAAMPYAVVHSRSATQFYALATQQTPENRRADYLAQLLSADQAAKELRLFGLSDYLLGRHRQILERHERQNRALAWRRSVRSVLAGALPAIAYVGIYAYFAQQALAGRITAGDLMLYTGAVLRSQDLLQGTIRSLSGIVENSLYLDDYFGFLALEPKILVGVGGPAPPPIREGVRFEEVSFRYQDSPRRALSDLCLDLPTGKTVAIVGENGSGKTTLVKLLARLYDPDSGRVTVDGRDVREFDAGAWRRQIGVVFQDFVQYYLTAAENIGLGRVDALDDQQRVEAAAKRSGADRVIARLSQGYHTVLGRWFDHGTQLSGGEWQRIALARAFMSDAPILVLDEPTSALDARAEYEMFRRIQELSRGHLVLLISHRFSTVRMADCIYVLEAGRVVEAGNHEELLAQGGRYAELFQLQAAGYR